MLEITSKAGTRIRQVRSEKNLSQQRFGEKIGVSRQSISAYETSKVTPSIKVLEKISNIYNVSFIRISDTPDSKIKRKIDEIEKEIGNLKEMLDKSLSF